MNNSANYSPSGYRLLAKELSKSFGYHSVFSGISFEAHHGDKVAIQGPNGSGKTTLLKILGGLLNPSSGQIETTSASSSNKAILSVTGPWLTPYLPLTLMENISFVQKTSGSRKNTDDLKMMLRRLNLLDKAAEMPLMHYSSGMLQKSRIAIALSTQPAILLLDEPTEYLDDSGRVVVRKLMDEFCDAGTLVVASNDAQDLTKATIVIEIGGAS